MTVPPDKGKSILWTIDPRTHQPARWQRIKFNFTQGSPQTGLEVQRRSRPKPPDVADEFVVSFRERDASIATSRSCIYCNAPTKIPGSISRLTEEHIIPSSIGGTKTIDHASCQDCMNRVGSYESKIISQLFWTPTKALKVGLKKKTFKGHAIHAFVGENSQAFNLPLAEHPSFLFLPTYHPPRNLVMDASGIVDTAGGWAKQINETVDWQTALQQKGFNGMATIGIDILSFSKFLAKIAFGFAIAKYGQTWHNDGSCHINGFRVGILDFLKSRPPRVSPKCDFSFLDFIGGLGAANYEPSEHLHGVSVRVERFMIYEYICVYIQLFSNLGSPIYKVVVAQRPA